MDNEINSFQRVFLSARNEAINTGKFVTVCPLDANNTCSNNWGNEITVFSNSENSIANSIVYDNANDTEILIKEAINQSDTVVFTPNQLIYSPTGSLVIQVSGTIVYCPEDKTEFNRGIEVSTSGRVLTTKDYDKDGDNETRAGTALTCV